MDSSYNVFMVTLQLKPTAIEHLVELLPYQQTVIQRFTAEGKLLHYALSLDSQTVWMVFQANDTQEVAQWVNCFPICRAGTCQIHNLENFHIHHKNSSSSLN